MPFLAAHFFVKNPNQKNYGLNLELERLQASPEDWVFGAVSDPCITDIPNDEREKYLPKGERQNIGQEKSDCATRWIMNKLEAKLNWLLLNKKLLPENEKWAREIGFITENGWELSDRFIAVLSNTTRQGNSMKAPLEAVRKYGVIPKSKLPQAFTFDEHHSKEAITGSLLAIGEQFKARFKINYEKVYEIHYEELLKDDMLGVAGYAWVQPVNGEYPKIDYDPNHAFLVYKTPAFYAFDNYEEAPGDFIKKLAPDYNFLEYGYRVYISAQYLPSNNFWLAEILAGIWQMLFPIKEKIEALPKPEPKPEEPKPEVLLWDKANARHSVRVICDQEGLTLHEKNIITACIQQESNFDNAAIGRNSTSTDWGICQVNDYWQIGKGRPFATVEEVVNNPEKVVRWMIRMYKAGKLKLWVSYSSGAYLKYMPK